MNILRLLHHTATQFFAISALTFSSFSSTAAPIQPGAPLLVDMQFQTCLDEAVSNNGWITTEEVTTLVCPGRGINIVDGIEKFVNLTLLDLSENKLIYVSPIQSLNQITQLNLTGNKRLDSYDVTTAIQNKPGLSHLGLGGVAMGNDLNWLPPANMLELDISNIGEIYDLYPLTQYTNLRVLKASGNLFYDVYPLVDLQQLEVLDLSENLLDDITWLQLLNNLKQLNLSNNQSINGTAWVDTYTINSILAANPMLTHLGLAGIDIGDLNQLNFYSAVSYNLIELDISNTNITDVSPLINLVNLNVLKANNNAIEYVNGIAPLPLRVLELNKNKIAGLGGINLSPSLQILDLSDNKLVDVIQLQFLKKLTQLNLSGNPLLNVFDIRDVIQSNSGLTHISVAGINMGSLLWLPPVGPMGEYNLQELDISNTGIFPDLQVLSQYSNLRVLKAAGNKIQYSGGLEQLSNLEVLDINNNNLFDINTLQGLNKLTQLNMSGNKYLPGFEVQSIIQNNPGLTHLGVAGIVMGDYLDWLPAVGIHGEYDLIELDISNTGVFFDMYPVAQYSNLKVLKAAGNEIWGTWPLEQLMKLEVLDLSNNILNDINSLQYLRNLTQLTLSNNITVDGFPALDINDINPILRSNLKLTHLGIAGFNIGDLNQLDIYSLLSNSIKELDISNTNITNLYPLIGVPNLNVLKANNNTIDSVFGLEQLPLRVLELSNNLITSLGVLDASQQLKVLDLSGNKLFDANSLQMLTKLIQLNLSGNNQLQAFNVKSIVQSNPGLTHISVGDITMGDLSWLPSKGPQGEFNLVELDISNTGSFSDLEPLSQFDSLKVIKAAGNQLQTVGPIESLQQLEVVDLNNNQLFDASALQAISKLTRLNLSGNNQLQQFNVQSIIQANPGLTHISIAGIKMGGLYWLPAAGPQGEFNLVELDISNTGEIFDLNPLLQQPNLKVLKIADNQLWDAWYIDQLMELEVLDLSNNNLMFVPFLTSLMDLLSVDLSGNNSLQCSELDALQVHLETKQPAGVLTRPLSCILFMPPEISILNPLDASQYFDSSTINFIAISNDVEDGDLGAQIIWVSNIDGALGTGAILNIQLTAGEHIITAAVTDSHNNTTTMTVNITVLQNSVPQLTINSMLNGAIFNQGETILLAADAIDDEEGVISQNIQWSSSIDGSLGIGASLEAVLSVGSHVINVSITDTAGASTTQAINVTINALPQLTLQLPLTDSVYQQGTTVNFAATANDAEDGDLGVHIFWSSSIDGVLGIGLTLSQVLSVGNHIITTTVTDSNGAITSQTVSISVNAPPGLTLLSPSNDSLFMLQEMLELSATASDTEDGNISANIQWMSNIDGVLGTGSILEKSLSLGTHSLTASITDSGGATRSVSTQVIIDQIALDIVVKSRGINKTAILTWSGSRTDVEIYRDGKVIDTDTTSGIQKYRFRNQAYFKVCESGTINCSVEILAE